MVEKGLSDNTAKQPNMLDVNTEQHASSLSGIEERYALVMAGVCDGVWDWNLETDHVYYSPRWQQILGFEDNELEPTLETWQALIHPDDVDNVFDTIKQQTACQYRSFDIEMRMRDKQGQALFVNARVFDVIYDDDSKPIRLLGTLTDATEVKREAAFNENHAKILEMIALGRDAVDIYDSIALMYEQRHPGLRCSMLELHDGTLLHGGAPSLPNAYCEAIHGLKNGPNVGSCGTSTFTGKRVIVENIETDPKWEKIKHVALPFGMRCCWSEPIKNSSGIVLGAFGMYYDYPSTPDDDDLNDMVSAARLAGIVMERDQDQKQIRQLAYTDQLTSLPSRRSFQLTLEKVIRKCSRHQHRFGLLYIDIDNFKQVNDSLGHDAGDELLKVVANHLKNTCREGDFVARLGGDEFCIITEEIDDYSTAEVARRCLQAVAQPFELLSRTYTPACSIGIAHYPDDGEDIGSLIKAADTSLYAAKESGKNQYTFYNPELGEKAQYLFQLESSLREAIKQQQLTLVYQPKIEVATGKVLCLEALSRWHHPELGDVSPIEFIETAERIDMIKPHTEWVITTACRQLVKLKQHGFDELKMSVNISPNHFLDPSLPALLKQIIAETGVTAADLQLEVTENVVQTDTRNLAVFNDLKKLGIHLALDDFGTGYSSLASLKHLSVDSLKIDRYFISDFLDDKNVQILVKSMIEMGTALGYQLTAEGVETQKQFDALKAMGCMSVQGYLFSKPVDSEQLVTLLTQLESRRASQ